MDGRMEGQEWFYKSLVLSLDEALIYIIFKIGDYYAYYDTIIRACIGITYFDYN